MQPDQTHCLSALCYFLNLLMSLINRAGLWLAHKLMPSSRIGRRVRIQQLWERAERHYRSGEFAQAEEAFKKIVSLSETFGQRSAELLENLDRVGEFFHSSGYYAEAEQSLRRALQIRESDPTTSVESRAHAVNNLALILYAQGRYAEAEPFYRQLLELSRLLEDASAVAVALENYAALLRKLKRDPESDQLRARAAKIRRQLREQAQSK